MKEAKVVKRLAVLFGTLGVLSACEITAHDYEMRGFTKEELEAPPSFHEIRAALIADVRRWRMLESRLEEGVPTCSALIYVANAPTCAHDKEPFEVYSLRDDLRDQPYRVEEKAYYCRTEGLYYYNYVGGPKKLNVWLGPFKLSRQARKADD
jgi:hypothetical protein